jgi:hypothetical protein
MTTAMLKDIDPFVWKLARKGAIDDEVTTAVDPAAGRKRKK